MFNKNELLAGTGIFKLCFITYTLSNLIMQKFEKSLEGFDHPSAKKNTTKKTKIIINVSGTKCLKSRNTILCCKACCQKVKMEPSY